MFAPSAVRPTPYRFTPVRLAPHSSRLRPRRALRTRVYWSALAGNLAHWVAVRRGRSDGNVLNQFVTGERSVSHKQCKGIRTGHIELAGAGTRAKLPPLSLLQWDVGYGKVFRQLRCVQGHAIHVRVVRPFRVPEGKL